MSINFRWGRFASWCRKNGLFCAIVSWIFLAIIAYTLLSAIWGDGHGWNRVLTGWHIGATHDPLDRIKVTLTALGGVGAVGYLVIKYRERSALERGEADEKLVRSVQQLGDPSPQVRIAGVYALADVADTYEGPYHQRVVDILCGYLRTDRLLKNSNGETRYASNKDGSPNYDLPLSSDGPVESAILSIIANHLRSPCADSDNKDGDSATSGPWSSYRIDLHNTTLTEQVNFADCHFKQLDLRRAKLLDLAIFSRSHFIGSASFEYSTFKQPARFDRTHFESTSSFHGANFERDTHFNDVKFDLASYFNEVTFAGTSKFCGTLFYNLCDFTGSTFMQDALFYNIKFGLASYFYEVTFAGRSDFHKSVFSDICYFTDSTFMQDALFKETEFFKAKFDKCTFMQGVDFTPSKIESSDAAWTLDTGNPPLYMLDGNLKSTFFGANFNTKLRNTDKIIFPEHHRLSISRSSQSKMNGLPEGAVWVDFETPEYHSLLQE